MHIKQSTDDIIRVPRSTYAFMVAIKIGPPNNRNYTALKHYIVSSDNRTYNYIVRNMIEYITIDSQNQIPTNQSTLPHNLLVSGAPGTGKSHYLEKEVLHAGKSIIDKAIKEDPSFNENDIKRKTAEKNYCDNYMTRVTFYEDYSYENFVGCYKPIPIKSESDIKYAGQNGKITEDKITYEFVAGPFIDTYIKAKKDTSHLYFLIIEEINRAKAASVFGDIFQLLDRKDGVSEYDVKPDAALDEYLRQNLSLYNGSINLPSNMYIWATMNSADQGVMPLDSAFKRRWAQLYMDINPDSNKARGNKLNMPSKDGIKSVLWENLRERINDIILDNGFDEDRCIGSWYFKDEELTQINEYYAEHDENKRKTMINPLIDKLFYYLRQDVFRRNPGKMFKSETDKKPGITMSDLRRRVRQNEPIDHILNIKDILWISNSADTDTNDTPENNNTNANPN